MAHCLSANALRGSGKRTKWAFAERQVFFYLASESRISTMSEEKVDISSGKTEAEMEIDMLELCIRICEEHGDWECVKKLTAELHTMKERENATS